MMIRTLSLEKLPEVRPILIRFLKKHGDGRITHKAIRWLKQIQATEVKPGTLILLAFHQQKLVGLMAFSHYGIEHAITAVHPNWRKQGIGMAMLKKALSQLKKVYTRVAYDNIPSLKLCFSCGLVAFDMIKGPTGKPTLLLGGGEWKHEDIQKDSHGFL